MTLVNKDNKRFFFINNICVVFNGLVFLWRVGISMELFSWIKVKVLISFA
jgi:hypothetical protein